MKDLHKLVNKLDPALVDGSDSFNIALVLLAASSVGINADSIAERAKIHRSVARRWVARAKINRIFVDGKIRHSGWFDKTSGGIAFWMDVAVVQGLLIRSKEKPGPKKLMKR